MDASRKRLINTLLDLAKRKEAVKLILLKIA